MIVDVLIFKDVVRVANALRHQLSVRIPRISLPRDKILRRGNQNEQASPNERHYRCECVGRMGLSDYRFDHAWRSVNEHLPASSRLCHIGYDALGHLLSCEFSGTTKMQRSVPEISTTDSVVIGKFRASCLSSRLAIFLSGGLENLFKAQKRTYWL